MSGSPRGGSHRKRNPGVAPPPRQAPARQPRPFEAQRPRPAEAQRPRPFEAEQPRAFEAQRARPFEAERPRPADTWPAPPPEREWPPYGRPADQRAVAARRPRPDIAGRWPSSRWLSSRWLLAAILAVQSALSLRLVWANTAFLDEATYINAGHAEIAYWLHGTPERVFAISFSGAPVIYPPLGALADSAGGLAAARILSLCFMLIATALVWSAARRLFGPPTAAVAAALFAVTPSVQFLGALATYDAMALMLLAAAAWLVIRSGDAVGRQRVALCAAAVGFLVLANATKYASALWDPVVVALAGLAVARSQGFRRGLTALFLTAAATVGVLLAVLAIAGRSYQTGFRITTLSRTDNNVPGSQLFHDSVTLIGIVAVLAVLGAVLISRRSRHDDRYLVLTAWVLAGAVFLAPANQIRIHTLTSLFKHIGFGAWFGVIPAGFAICAVLEAIPSARRAIRFATVKRAGAAVAALACAVAAAAVVVSGAQNASLQMQSWPNTTALMAKLRPILARTGGGPWLAEDDSVPIYYSGTPMSDWSSTWSVMYQDRSDHKPLYNGPAYAQALSDHYYKVVVLDFYDTQSLDSQLASQLFTSQDNGGYRIVATVPIQPAGPGYYVIWRYEGR